MRIADMKDGEAVKARRQIGTLDSVLLDDDVLGISAPTPIKAGQLQDISNERMNGVPVLDMKEIEALTEDLGFMIGFDSQSLLGMDPAQTLL
jgi:hypothetical protein